MAGRVGMRSYDETPTSHQPGGVSRGTDRPAGRGATVQTPSALAAARRFRRRGRAVPTVAFPAKWYTSPAPPDVGVVPRAPLLPAGSLRQEVELQPPRALGRVLVLLLLRRGAEGTEPQLRVARLLRQPDAVRVEPQRAAVTAHQEGYASPHATTPTALLHVRVAAQTPQPLVLLTVRYHSEQYHALDRQRLRLALLRGRFTQGSFTLEG